MQDFPGAIWHSTLMYLDNATKDGKHHRDNQVAKITELNSLSSTSMNASPGSCKRHEGANTSICERQNSPRWQLHQAHTDST